MVKMYVSPRPMMLDSLAIGGLTTANMMAPAVPRVETRESLSKDEVA